MQMENDKCRFFFQIDWVYWVVKNLPNGKCWSAHLGIAWHVNAVPH